jgi:SAM-dependent methyltransferase
MDWHEWHDRYDRGDTTYPQRLKAVQARIAGELDRLPAGPYRIVSLCAGQGRDVIEVLAAHPRGGDAVVRLVELDPRNVEYARKAAADAGLEHVEAVCGDAADTNLYAGAVPADIVLVCGLFGNSPDLFPRICDWFEERGFAREWVSAPDAGFGVGMHRATAPPRPLTPDTTLFTFVGYDVLRPGSS